MKKYLIILPILVASICGVAIGRYYIPKQQEEIKTYLVSCPFSANYISFFDPKIKIHEHFTNFDLDRETYNITMQYPEGPVDMDCTYSLITGEFIN